MIGLKLTQSIWSEFGQFGLYKIDYDLDLLDPFVVFYHWYFYHLFGISTQNIEISDFQVRTFSAGDFESWWTFTISEFRLCIAAPRLKCCKVCRNKLFIVDVFEFSHFFPQSLKNY